MTMTKVETKKQGKEHALLDAAFELFTAKGISKTSINDISDKAGVGKGTFYLYFKDKYDIRDRLIAIKSGQVLTRAADALKSRTDEPPFEEAFIFLVDNIINQLDENKSLLGFISKNLSWGVFVAALSSPGDKDVDFRDAYYKLISFSERPIRDPELMLYMIVELVSSTCYSTILYKEPCPLEKLKPELYRTIRGILAQFQG